MYLPGDSIALPVINLQVKNPATHLPEGLYNYAEISRATDTAGVVPPDGDIDSNWDSDPNNDTGGGLFNDDDNNVTGDHFKEEDEDDHDGAFVIVCKGYVCQDKVTHLACRLQNNGSRVQVRDSFWIILTVYD